MTKLTLSFFGSFDVRLAGQPVTDFDSDKARALLVYLAVEQEHPHRREHLAGLFWPDKSDRAARNNLRHVLAKLRHAIGDQTANPPLLLISNTALQINAKSNYHCDVTTFHGLMEPGLNRQKVDQLERAAALYRGPFLEGFSPGISPAFDDWLYLLRERLQQQALSGLAWLATHYGDQGDYLQAGHYAQQQITLAPWREEAHQQRMRYLALSGQRSAALTQFETCRHYLAQEFETDPSRETLILVEQIRSGALASTSAAQPPTVQTPEPMPPPHNLPVQTTAFIGRKTELSRLKGLLDDPNRRVITLHGPGGMGKTRLALEVATGQITEYPDGVYFVSLASVAELDPLIAAIADTVGYPFQNDSRLPDRQLLDFLREKRMLLLLDNLEQLLEAAPFLNDILQTAPGVRVLTTSRARLMLSGETVFTLGGMPVPEPGMAPDVESEAMALFTNAAQRVEHNFSLTVETGELVAQICRAVQGMPLGVLLAVSWIGQLTLAEIATQVMADDEGCLDFLETEWRDFPDRQRSMRAVCEHSWRLLSAGEQAVFSRLAVFRGGFTRQAAGTVAGASLRVLTTLVNKSLLQREPNGRYTMHELLRQFAQAQLEAAGQLAPAGEAHATYYLGFLAQREPDLKGARQMTALAEIEVESENVRVTWQWGIDGGRIADLRQVAESLGRFYKWRGRYREGERAFSLATVQFEPAQQEAAQRLWLRVIAWQATFDHILGRLQQVADLLQRGLDRLEDASLSGLDLRAERALLLRLMGLNVRKMSSYEEAKPYLRQSLALCREIDDPWELAQALDEMAGMALDRGDYDSMQSMFEESLTIRRALGDLRGEARRLGSLSFCHLEQGRHAQAESLMRASFDAFQKLGDVPVRDQIAGSLGILLLMLGHYEEACERVTQNLQSTLRLGDTNRGASLRVSLAEIQTHLGRDDEAETQARQGLTLGQQQNDQWAEAGATRCLGRLALTRKDYAAARRHLRTSLNLSASAGPRELHFRARVLLAFAERGLGNHAQAKQYLLTAFKETRESYVQVTLLHAFSLMALLYLDQGHLDRAIDLYALAADHPIVANSRWFEQMVGEPIEAAAATLDPSEVAAAQSQGRARDFAATRETLIAELEEAPMKETTTDDEKNGWGNQDG